MLTLVQQLASQIRQQPPESIVFFVGAGISVAAGIPDFRSPAIGLYASIHEMKRFRFKSPTFVFEIDEFMNDPRPFWWIFSRLWPKTEWPHPTDFHYLMALLAEEGIVSHVFTQNVDNLEEVAGIDQNLISCAHGTLNPCKCLKCGHKFPLSEALRQMTVNFPPKEDYEDVIPPVCPNCGDNHVKPEVVFFGENLPSETFTSAHEYIPKASLAIISGTSLNVEPFASFPKMLKENSQIYVINREKVKEQRGGLIGALHLSSGYINYEDEKCHFIEGDLQETARQLIYELGWDERYQALKTRIESIEQTQTDS